MPQIEREGRDERRCLQQGEGADVGFDASRCRPAPYGLSERERCVLVLLAEGLPDREIALTLGVTVYTINKQVGSILLKMNVRSRTAAAVRAIRERLFDRAPFVRDAMERDVASIR